MRLSWILITCVLLFGCVPSALAQSAPPPADWTGSDSEKVFGLMKVWGGVRYTFPHVDRLDDLDWDATVEAFVPRVLAAEDLDSYYAELMELVAMLGDSHTMVLPPWGHLKPGYDIVPLEVQVLDGRFFVAATAAEGVEPGMEILRVDGVPVREYFDQNVVRYRNWGAPQANEAALSVYLLYGPAIEPVTVAFRASDGSELEIELQRNAMSGPEPFMTRQLLNAFAGPTIRTRMLEGGIQYVEIPNFEHDQARIDFEALVDGLADTPVTGMVIDLRYNMGGSSSVAGPMVACLIDEPVPTPTMKYRHFVGAHVAWGRETIWDTSTDQIEPRDGARFEGSLVVLVGGLTNSSAEDFAIELRAGGRATLVGQRTAGGAGNSLNTSLPGGGTLRVSTFTAVTPEGVEYVGVGIDPDVRVKVTQEDLAVGRDPVLERALELLSGM